MRLILAKATATPSHASVVVVPTTRLDGLILPWWKACDDAWTKPLLDWLREIRFQGDLAEIAVCASPGRPHQVVLFTGLGDVTRVESGRVIQAVAAALIRVRKMKSVTVDLLLQPPHPQTIPDDELLALAARGVFSGRFNVGEAPQSMAHTNPTTVRLLVPRPSAPLRRRLNEEVCVGLVLQRTRTLANHPGNIASPEGVVRYVKKVKARNKKLQVTIWGPSALRRMQCHALLAVGQGSRYPTYLIEIRHRGEGKGRPVALVGKTITFDSGGLSLKPAKSMEWMRYDKCGGMAVLGAIEAVHQLGLKQPVVALLAVAENMPGGNAIRPGDVIYTRSGKSVEVLNTDAEGRLVLADALDVARLHKPRCVVDLATLTGAATVALGHPYSALFGRPAGLVEQLRAAGERTGEKLWPMPLHPDYDTMLNSTFADMKNTGDGTAGAVAGAMFLQRFVPAALPWCHLDLTRAWLEGNTACAPAGATLFGAHLLVDWLRHLEPETTPR